ncbi:MAG: WYL domain-containing protein, partial [Rhodoglobus sp.]
NPDGSVDLWVPYSDHRELVLDIKRYGAEVEVLAPDSLKEEVMSQLEKTLLIYENANQKNACACYDLVLSFI